MAEASDDRKMLSIERWGIPVSMVIGIVGSTVWAMGVVRGESEALGKRIMGVEHHIDMMRRDLSYLNESVVHGVSNAQAQAWIAIFAAKNPNLVVPNLPAK